MTDLLRTLCEQGDTKYREWLNAARLGSLTPAPTSLLTDPVFSEELTPSTMIEREPIGRPFESRYEFGCYLRDRLGHLSKQSISRHAGLWNWLSLYYIDQLAPPDERGARTLVDPEVYVLAGVFKYDSYYRHAVRTSWLAVQEHGENSRVMLVPAGRGRPGVGTLAHRGELIEQLAARQQIMGSKTVIEGAARLYLDPLTLKPRHGAGGSGRGSPRRFGLVLQQLELTYDLSACNADEFLRLLPKEFDRWKSSPPSSHAPSRGARLLKRLGFGGKASPEPGHPGSAA